MTYLHTWVHISDVEVAKVTSRFSVCLPEDPVYDVTKNPSMKGNTPPLCVVKAFHEIFIMEKRKVILSVAKECFQNWKLCYHTDGGSRSYNIATRFLLRSKISACSSPNKNRDDEILQVAKTHVLADGRVIHSQTWLKYLERLTQVKASWRISSMFGIIHFSLTPRQGSCRNMLPDA